MAKGWIFPYPLVVLCLMWIGFLTGCDTSGDIVTAETQSPEEELISLINNEINLPSEMLITSTKKFFVEEFEPSGNRGMLTNRVHWGVLTSEDTRFLFLAMALTGSALPKMQAATDCSVEAEAGMRKKIRFAKCVENLHEHCDGAWTWTDENGDSHADGYNLVRNEKGNWELTDCDPSG
ncbi:MAG: hypothetical protein OXE92_08760 [Bacteroidetes bacterium]|nr:hypothetical protein [Bacteroidota bacterium]